jgi:hypothetical protein
VVNEVGEEAPSRYQPRSVSETRIWAQKWMGRHQESKSGSAGSGSGAAVFVFVFVILVRRKGRQGRQGGGYVQVVRSRECRETFVGRGPRRFEPVEWHAEEER